MGRWDATRDLYMKPKALQQRPEYHPALAAGALAFTDTNCPDVYVGF